MAQDTAICRSPHTSSNSHSHITTQSGHKYTFCQNVVPTNNCFSLYFRKNITCFSVGPLRICPVPSVCSHTVYLCVTTYCCFMKNISQCATCFGLMWAIIRKNHSYKRRIWHWYVSSYVPTNSCFSLYFRKTVPCWSVGLLRAGQILLSDVELCIGGLRHIAAVLSTPDLIFAELQPLCWRHWAIAINSDWLSVAAAACTRVCAEVAGSIWIVCRRRWGAERPFA